VSVKVNGAGLTLQGLVAEELSQPVDTRISDMAKAIAAQHGNASRAVLFYGSCLRESQLEGLMLDFYLIVSDYRAAYTKGWLAHANRLIPPNVFPFAHDGLAAKYAVLSEDDFIMLNQPEARTVSVWARFAQPTRIVWSADDVARARALAAVGQAVPTLFSLAYPLVGNDDPRRNDPLSVWRAGFAETYKAELRAERVDRSGSIVDSDPERYARFGAAILQDNGQAAALSTDAVKTRRRWNTLQRRGKIMSVLRLAKASLTFAGGIDYLAWKINRHAGTKIVITPWQRRWPIIAGILLVPKLFRSGAVK
jgi:hypothetical protein